MMIKIYNITKGNWIAGVSDGLILPCRICGKVPKFDYRVDDAFWKRVVDKKDRTWVICLPCLDKLASDKGLDVAKHLIDVQYTGIGKTIELTPSKIYYYENIGGIKKRISLN